ncbi:MAG: hypothetical protein MUE65_06360 [Methanomassiliicoccales archaeon]|nr:hypothetical protein [Methanomassiliicoccales archaeon]
MYCPKCDRTIKKERLEALRKELAERYQRDQLEKGRCPVCSTPLLDLEEVRRKKDAR